MIDWDCLVDTVGGIYWIMSGTGGWAGDGVEILIIGEISNLHEVLKGGRVCDISRRCRFHKYLDIFLSIFSHASKTPPTQINPRIFASNPEKQTHSS